MAHSRHPDAAVLTADDPAADAAARVVPARAKLRKVGGAVAGYDHQPSRPTHRARFPRIRLSEVERLIEHRHGGPARTDDADLYACIAVPLLVEIATARRGDEAFVPPDPKMAVIRWCTAYLPLVDQATIARLIADAPNAPRLDADAAARALGVTMRERLALRLGTFGAVDLPAAERKAEAAARKRERDRERAGIKRRAAGAVPRATFEASSRTAEAARQGISRRTLSRHLKRRAESACPTSVASPVIGEMGRDGRGTPGQSEVPAMAPINTSESASEAAA